MLYLISYDISIDKRRTTIARLLEGFGQRVLESVFECDLDQREYATLRKKLNRRVRPEEGDRLRIYQLCATCHGRVEVIGEGPAVERSPTVIII